jgi:type IV secretion system protein VirB6
MGLVWFGSMALMLVSSVVFLTADLTMKFMLITAPTVQYCSNPKRTPKTSS